jgi:hypothetical protein
MPFKSKAQARAAFAGAIPGLGGNKAKKWASKTNFSKIPDHVANESLDGKKEFEKVPSAPLNGSVKVPTASNTASALPTPQVTSGVPEAKPVVTSGVDAPKVEVSSIVKEELNTGKAKVKPEVNSGVKAPAPQVTSGVKAPKPEVTSVVEEVDNGKMKIKPEVNSGVKAPAPQVTSGVKSPKPEVTSVVSEELEKGEAKSTPQVTSGVKAPKPEVKSGVSAPKPEVVQAVKEEVEKGEAKTKPDATDGLKSPKQETGTKGKPGSEEKQATPTPPVSEPVKAAGATEGFEGKTEGVDGVMDEGSAAKHKSLEEKVKAMQAEMEALQKEMEGVKELGVKKHIHNTKKEEVAKLGEEIRELKEKKKDPMKIPGHEGDDRKNNQHMPKATKTIPSKKWKLSKNRKGWKKDAKKEMDEKAKVLSEGFTNAYVSKVSRKNLISERVLLTYWAQAIKMQEEAGENKNKANKGFWYGVVKNFNGILNEQELVKAKSTMTEREKFSMNTEQFINCLASDDYITASNHMNEMVNSSLANLIDTTKVQYQKELGEKVSKKIREV